MLTSELDNQPENLCTFHATYVHTHGLYPLEMPSYALPLPLDVSSYSSPHVNGSILSQNVVCSGTEERLVDCRSSGPCTHAYDVGVICLSRKFFSIYVTQTYTLNHTIVVILPSASMHQHRGCTSEKRCCFVVTDEKSVSQSLFISGW